MNNNIRSTGIYAVISQSVILHACVSNSFLVWIDEVKHIALKFFYTLAHLNWNNFNNVLNICFWPSWLVHDWKLNTQFIM